MIDTHVHVLPAVDDGPATMEQAVAMCRMAAADGVSTLIATPHQRHSMWGNLDVAALAALRAELQARVGETPRLLAGAEVRVDGNLLADVDGYPGSGLQPLADSRYLLLEFPSAGGPEARPLLHELLVAGWFPILAHAERVPRWADHPEQLAELAGMGALLQITAGSVLGDFGRRARACAVWLLDRGLIHLVGSDAHDTVERPPGLSRAYEAIAKGWGAAAADRLTLLNPSDIVDHRPPLRT